VNSSWINERLKDGSGDHTFMIQFLDSGVQAFAFTFGRGAT